MIRQTSVIPFFISDRENDTRREYDTRTQQNQEELAKPWSKKDALLLSLRDSCPVCRRLGWLIGACLLVVTFEAAPAVAGEAVLMLAGCLFVGSEQNDPYWAETTGTLVSDHWGVCACVCVYYGKPAKRHIWDFEIESKAPITEKSCFFRECVAENKDMDKMTASQTTLFY